MTISATQVRKTFTGDGSTTAFTYNYRFLANADLKVYQNGTLKTITTHYTVTGAGAAGGGTVTFLTAPALNDEIVIINDPSNTQTLDLVDNDIFPAESMEQALDRLTLQIQRCRDLLSRTVTLSDTDLSAGTWTLPSPVASYYLRWNAGGTQLESVAALASTVAVSPFTETLLDETSASAWRTGLGLGTLAIQNAANVTITGGSISNGVALPAATETYAGALELATSAEHATGTDSTRALTSAVARANNLVLSTAQATTSGTAKDFTGIPSWVKRVTVCLSGVSTSGSSNYMVQLGTSGGLKTADYLGAAVRDGVTGSAAHSNGFALTGVCTAATTLHGSITFTHMGSNVWVASGVFGHSDAIGSDMVGGAVTLSGTLDRLRLTTVGGSDTFDAGSVNILYE